MRRHVKPAHPDASIPDPARGRDLPPEGLPCNWSAHWARLAARGDVIVTEIPEAAAEEAPAEVAEPEPEQQAHLPIPATAG